MAVALGSRTFLRLGGGLRAADAEGPNGEDGFLERPRDLIVDELTCHRAEHLPDFLQDTPIESLQRPGGETQVQPTIVEDLAPASDTDGTADNLHFS